MEMDEREVLLETYADQSYAERDVALLEYAGFHPSLREELSDAAADGFVFAIYVPQGESERAYQALQDFRQDQDSEYDLAQ